MLQYIVEEQVMITNTHLQNLRILLIPNQSNNGKNKTAAEFSKSGEGITGGFIARASRRAT